MSDANDAGAAYTVSGQSGAADVQDREDAKPQSVDGTPQKRQGTAKEEAEDREQRLRAREQAVRDKEEAVEVKEQDVLARELAVGVREGAVEVREQDVLDREARVRVREYGIGLHYPPVDLLPVVAPTTNARPQAPQQATEPAQLSVLSWNIVVQEISPSPERDHKYHRHVLASLRNRCNTHALDVLCTQHPEDKKLVEVRSLCDPGDGFTRVQPFKQTRRQQFYVPDGVQDLRTVSVIMQAALPATLKNNQHLEEGDADVYASLCAFLDTCDVTKNGRKWTLISYHGPYRDPSNVLARRNTQFIVRLMRALHEELHCPVIVCGSLNDSAPPNMFTDGVRCVQLRTTVQFGDTLVDGPYHADTILYIGCDLVDETEVALSSLSITKDCLGKTRTGTRRSGRVHLLLGATFRHPDDVKSKKP